MQMKIHMRQQFMSHYNHMKFISRNTPMGIRSYLLDANWQQHDYEAQQYRAAMKARRQEKFMEMLAAEIAKNKGKPQPSKDLF
jgi:hypothetical protein